jgi:hypothetical protein
VPLLAEAGAEASARGAGTTVAAAEIAAAAAEGG